VADLRFVVRHAKAGRRSAWVGDDAVRPLSKAGWCQAEDIADRLAGEHVTGLYSSPYLRCVQTLEPLAKLLGLAVIADDRLGEGSSLEASLALLAEAGPGAVLCSHGDVIPDLVGGLVRRGAELRTKPDWRKGALWVLTGSGDGDTGIAAVAAEPPPTPRPPPKS